MKKWVAGLMALVLSVAAGWLLVTAWSGSPSDRAGSSPPPPSSASASSTPDARHLPFPYCFPDAQAPDSQAIALPPLPPGTDRPLADAPYATSLVTVGILEVVEPTTEDSFGNPRQEATVQIEEVLWRTPFARKSEIQAAADVGVGPSRMEADPALWAGVEEAVQSEIPVVVGLVSLLPNGAYSAAFALSDDAANPTYYGPQPYAERNTLVLRAFAESEMNPVRGSTPSQLVVQWNDETVGGSFLNGPGPISEAWDRFLREAVGGHTGAPPVSSPEGWAAAPADCRNISDAPASERANLIEGVVWFDVPDSWLELADGVLCLRIPDLGDNGCITLDPYGTGHPFPIHSVYADPNKPLMIEVAYLGPDGPSWVDRVRIGEIPGGQFGATGRVLVRLDGGLNPSTFAELKADADRYGTAATGVDSISQAQDRDLREQAASELSTDL